MLLITPNKEAFKDKVNRVKEHKQAKIQSKRAKFGKNH